MFARGFIKPSKVVNSSVLLFDPMPVPEFAVGPDAAGELNFQVVVNELRVLQRP